MADLLFILFGFSCLCWIRIGFYLFGWIQTSQTVGDSYSDASPMVSVPWIHIYVTYAWMDFLSGVQRSQPISVVSTYVISENNL